MFRRKSKPTPDDGLLFVGLVDAIIVLASALVSKDVMTREELAELYRLAVSQQAAQGQGGSPRGLAVQTIAHFFATPVVGDRSRIKLVVDNGRPLILDQ